jgi:hypothetical protein
MLMADFLNSAPKYVVSSTIDTLEWANLDSRCGN